MRNLEVENSLRELGNKVYGQSLSIKDIANDMVKYPGFTTTQIADAIRYSMMRLNELATELDKLQQTIK